LVEADPEIKEFGEKREKETRARGGGRKRAGENLMGLQEKKKKKKKTVRGKGAVVEI